MPRQAPLAQRRTRSAGRARGPPPRRRGPTAAARPAPTPRAVSTASAASRRRRPMAPDRSQKAASVATATGSDELHPGEEPLLRRRGHQAERLGEGPAGPPARRDPGREGRPARHAASVRSAVVRSGRAPAEVPEQVRAPPDAARTGPGTGTARRHGGSPSHARSARAVSGRLRASGSARSATVPARHLAPRGGLHGVRHVADPDGLDEAAGHRQRLRPADRPRARAAAPCRPRPRARGPARAAGSPSRGRRPR